MDCDLRISVDKGILKSILKFSIQGLASTAPDVNDLKTKGDFWEDFLLDSYYNWFDIYDNIRRPKNE